MSSTPNAPSVTVRYWIGTNKPADEVANAAAAVPVPTPTRTETLDAITAPTAAATTVTPKKPAPGDYSYCGMHDQGLLPVPLVDNNNAGSMTQLIASVQAAKKLNDTYLTEVIQQEKETEHQVTKRAKVQE